MKRRFLINLTLSINLIIIFLLSGCELTVKPEVSFKKLSDQSSQLTKPAIPKKTNKLKVEQVTINPNPCASEKAATIVVKTRGKISKVLIKIKGAESYLGEGVFLRPIKDNEWIVGFIAPQPGTYPVEVVLFDYQKNKFSFTSPNWILRVKNSNKSAGNVEDMIRDYFLRMIAEQPKVYKSIEVLRTEEVPLPKKPGIDAKNTKLFKVEIRKEYWDPEFSKRRKDEISIYYVYLSRNDPSAPWHISEVNTTP